MLDCHCELEWAIRKRFEGFYCELKVFGERCFHIEENLDHHLGI